MLSEARVRDCVRTDLNSAAVKSAQFISAQRSMAVAGARKVSRPSSDIIKRLFPFGRTERLEFLPDREIHSVSGAQGTLPDSLGFLAAAQFLGIWRSFNRRPFVSLSCNFE